MRLLLYCDEYCYKYKGNYYLEEFGLILLNRYLEVFETVTYPVRVKEVKHKEELGEFNKPIDLLRVKVVDIPFAHGMGEYFKNYFSIQSRLKNVCNECDLAILRLPSIYAFNVWKYVKRNRLPYAVEIVFDCYDGYTAASSFMERVSWKLMHHWQQIACENAEGVSCVTSEYLQRRYYSKKPNAIVSHYSSIELPQSFFYHKRNFSDLKPFRIIHVAYQVSFNSRKGHNQLIEALKNVRDRGLDVEINFVGMDYDNGYEKLMEYAARLGVQRYVHFVGFLGRKELRDMMIKSAIAVLPTKAEGLPRVVIEAMATGLPCISTNVSGNPELLEEKYLINYSDVKALADAIENLLKNPKEYERASLVNFTNSQKYEATYLRKKRVEFYTALKCRIKKSKNDNI